MKWAAPKVTDTLDNSNSPVSNKALSEELKKMFTTSKILDQSPDTVGCGLFFVNKDGYGLASSWGMLISFVFNSYGYQIFESDYFTQRRQLKQGAWTAWTNY